MCLQCSKKKRSEKSKALPAHYTHLANERNSPPALWERPFPKAAGTAEAIRTPVAPAGVYIGEQRRARPATGRALPAHSAYLCRKQHVPSAARAIPVNKAADTSGAFCTTRPASGNIPPTLWQGSSSKVAGVPTQSAHPPTHPQCYRNAADSTSSERKVHSSHPAELCSNSIYIPLPAEYQENKW